MIPYSTHKIEAVIHIKVGTYWYLLVPMRTRGNIIKKNITDIE